MCRLVHHDVFGFDEKGHDAKPFPRRRFFFNGNEFQCDGTIQQRL
jgi:hypothetical protein